MRPSYLEAWLLVRVLQVGQQEPLPPVTCCSILPAKSATTDVAAAAPAAVADELGPVQPEEFCHAVGPACPVCCHQEQPQQVSLYSRHKRLIAAVQPAVQPGKRVQGQATCNGEMGRLVGVWPSSCLEGYETISQIAPRLTEWTATSAAAAALRGRSSATTLSPSPVLLARGHLLHVEVLQELHQLLAVQ